MALMGDTSLRTPVYVCIPSLNSQAFPFGNYDALPVSALVDL